MLSRRSWAPLHFDHRGACACSHLDHAVALQAPKQYERLPKPILEFGRVSSQMTNCLFEQNLAASSAGPADLETFGNIERVGNFRSGEFGLSSCKKLTAQLGRNFVTLPGSRPTVVVRQQLAAQRS